MSWTRYPYTRSMRTLPATLMIAVCLIASGCLDTNSSSSDAGAPNQWYKVGYTRCNRIFSRDQAKIGPKDALKLLRLPKGMQNHQTEFLAGCRAAAKDAGGGIGSLYETTP
jgi:hypothetical protein